MRLDNHTHETQRRAFDVAKGLEAMGLSTNGFRTQEMADGSRRVVTFVDGTDTRNDEVTIRVISPAPNIIAPQWALSAYTDWTVEILDGDDGGWQRLDV